jgi:hypothetical protein
MQLSHREVGRSAQWNSKLIRFNSGLVHKNAFDVVILTWDDLTAVPMAA